jgi:hypothetical protein
VIEGGKKEGGRKEYNNRKATGRVGIVDGIIKKGENEMGKKRTVERGVGIGVG